MEEQLEKYIDKLEMQKQSMRQDPSYNQYAYVTHEDLKHLNFANRINKIESISGMGRSSANPSTLDSTQTILFAIQTPHGSVLDVDSVTEELSQPENLTAIKAERAIAAAEKIPGQPVRRYHLIIDAE